MDRRDAGLASGLINTTRQIGGSLGLAALLTVSTTRATDLVGSAPGVAQTGGYDRAYQVAAVLLRGGRDRGGDTAAQARPGARARTGAPAVARSAAGRARASVSVTT